jgi:hypothetical protein
MPDSSRPGMSGRRLVPGAYATLSAALTGPPPGTTPSSGSHGASYRTGTVWGVGPHACYIFFTQGPGVDGGPAVLPILRPAAVALPTGVRIPDAGPWPVAVGDPCSVGAAGISLGHWLITPAHTWHPPAVTAGPTLEAAVALSRLRAAWPAAIPDDTAGVADGRDWFVGTPGAAARHELYAGIVNLASAGGPDPAEVLGSLIGLGPGLTPSGDDAVAGCLLTLRLLGRTGRLQAVSDALPVRLPATTALSASLVAAAARGYAAPQVIDLLHALGEGPRRTPGDCAQPGTSLGDSLRPTEADSPTPAHLEPRCEPKPGLRRLVAGVLAIGHSSGADLLTGVYATLAASALDRTFVSSLSKEAL